MKRVRWRRWAPVLLSAALVAWLVWTISPQALLEAAANLHWQALLPATAAMILALYVWDAHCLQVLYGTPDWRLSYPQALAVRGRSYLAGAINYELGQAALAWDIAQRQQSSLVSTLSRGVVLMLHDVFVLLSMGLLGSLLTSDPLVLGVRKFCLLGLLLLGIVPLAWHLAPAKTWRRLRQTRWAAWLDSWSWPRSARLVVVRVVYFFILVVYAAAALRICGIHLDPRVVLSTIPLVMLADGLPSVSGLGTRETALQLLLKPERPEILVALSLVWTTSLILGRSLIGLMHLWVPRLWRSAAGDDG